MKDPVMQNKKIMAGLLVLMMLSATAANALQAKAAKNDMTLLFRVSQKEYSRIFVRHDRIVSVKGKSSAFETRQYGDQDEGTLFIRPSEGQGNRPFSVFLSTEAGRHFTLMLQIMDIPAENIEIVPLSATSQATRWETALPYTRTLTGLVSAMQSGRPPEGYS